MLSKEDKVKNILAFLVILFGEDSILLDKIMDLHPDYLIEKYERYILSNIIEHDWGIHPSLRRKAFNIYCEKYNLSINQET